MWDDFGRTLHYVIIRSGQNKERSLVSIVAGKRTEIESGTSIETFSGEETK